MCKNTNHNHVSITKFGDFITESQVAQLLLEGNLMASETFLSKLSTISDNKIAYFLLKAFSNKTNIDKDLPQNWIDVTSKEDTISFMADRTATKLDNDSGQIFASTSRSEVKVGRFARSIMSELGETITDKEVETFVNAYKASKVDTSKKFELVSGLDIKKYYHHVNYAAMSSTLGGSCMRYDNCQKFFKIYTKNPEVCQLLVYLNKDNKVLGRALVWKLDKKDLYDKNQNPIECKAEYFMDRVYSINDSDITKFINYAKKNGWLYKAKMNSDETLGMIFKYGDETIFGRIVVKLKRAIFSKYPYVDTLTFCDSEENISNVGFIVDVDSDEDEGIILSDTGGDHDICSSCRGTGLDQSKGDHCRGCNGRCKVGCPDCHGGGKEFCPKCNGNGEIQCLKCSGNGRNICEDCTGRGYLPCGSCEGNGTNDCVKCTGTGSLGNCKKCNGSRTEVCPDCKGEEILCNICMGKGEYSRKWGNGMRTVKCKGCGGVGKGKTGKIGKDTQSCQCKRCAIFTYLRDGTRGWINRGTMDCKECHGTGIDICPDCTGYGRIRCKECEGRGRKNCKKCSSHGSIICDGCKGHGNTGQCDQCKGEGTIGKCPKCEGNRTINCPDCDGTGKRPEGADKSCPSCSGLLNKLKNNLKKGSYKLP